MPILIDNPKLMPNEFETAKALEDKLSKKFIQDYEKKLQTQFIEHRVFTPSHGLQITRTRVGE